MLGMKKQTRKDHGVLDAIHRTAMMVEFTPEGVISNANDNYLRLLAYSRDQLIGKHHAVLCDQEYTQHPAYAAFWRRMAQGECVSGLFKRVSRSGIPIWMHAAYTPVFDQYGHVTSVVKLATPVAAPGVLASQKSAVSSHRILATVTLSPEGVIQDANNALNDLLGYDAPQVQGWHYQQLCHAETSVEGEFDMLWQSLKQGDHITGDYHYMHAHGHRIRTEATFTPIMDGSRTLVAIVMALYRKHSADELEDMSVMPEQDAPAAEHVRTRSLFKSAKTNAQFAAETQLLTHQLDETLSQANELAEKLDDIVQRSNLLSINSSVEAARNDERGRDFAQISHAIRRLAIRTSRNAHVLFEDLERLHQLMKRARAALNGTTNVLLQEQDLASPEALVRELYSNVYDEVGFRGRSLL